MANTTEKPHAIHIEKVQIWAGATALARNFTRKFEEKLTLRVLYGQESDILMKNCHCVEFAKCHRGGQQRRNTDFSQADNDLKRFLEERNTKRIDSDGDLRQDKIIQK